MFSKITHTVSKGSSTSEERGLEFLCDKHSKDLKGNFQTLYRAISIDSDRSTIFRWLLQMKVAPYSYDLIDNLGRTSPNELTSGLEYLELGQKFMFIFPLKEFEQDQELCIGWKGSQLAQIAFGSCLISYKILEKSEGRSRLIVKLIIAHRHPLIILKKFFLSIGDYIMMQKQLRTFKSLSEKSFTEKQAKKS